MKNDRIDELGKNRYAQVKIADVCNRTVIGAFVLWIMWISTSLLIRFMQ